jgi:hypothetical protein
VDAAEENLKKAQEILEELGEPEEIQVHYVEI